MPDVVAAELHRVVAEPGREQAALQAGIVDRDGVVLDDEGRIQDRHVRRVAAYERVRPSFDDGEGRGNDARGARDPQDELAAPFSHAAPPLRSTGRSP